jgi:hypothetical protein
MSTEELLRLAREHHIILQDRGRAVGVWAPNIRVSQALRQAFKQQSPAILAHIRAGTVYACPSPELHRPYWTYTDKTFVCTACRRLTLVYATAS